MDSYSIFFLLVDHSTDLHIYIYINFIRRLGALVIQFRSTFIQAYTRDAWVIFEPAHVYFKQFDMVTSVDSDEPMQPPFKLRNSK